MKWSDLEDAFSFVSSSPYGSASACVSRATGETWWHSDLADMENENPLPEEASWNDEYVWIPHKNELDLGKALVLDFVVLEAPEELGKVEAIFSRRGAYRRFKNLLEDLGLLEEWYSFEERRTREALLSWAEEEGLPLEDPPGEERSRA